MPQDYTTIRAVGEDEFVEKKIPFYRSGRPGQYRRGCQCCHRIGP